MIPAFDINRCFYSKFGSHIKCFTKDLRKIVTTRVVNGLFFYKANRVNVIQSTSFCAKDLLPNGTFLPKQQILHAKRRVQDDVPGELRKILVRAKPWLKGIEKLLK